ncbi:MAG: SLATT domain-containing protein [Rhodothalassiaceae bacterium]
MANEHTLHPITKADSRSINDAYIEDYYERAKITRAVRFFASRRYHAKSKISLICISMLAIYALLANILLILYEGEKAGEFLFRMLTVVNIMIPAFILFFNAFEFSKGYDLISDKMRASADLLSRLLEKIEFFLLRGAITDEEVEAVREEYQEAIRDLPEDDGQIDFYMVLLDNTFVTLSSSDRGSKKYENFYKARRKNAWLYWIQHKVDLFGPVLLYIVVPGLFVSYLAIGVLA